MRWPWQQPEDRAAEAPDSSAGAPANDSEASASTYTDALTALIVDGATGSGRFDASSLAALEIASGFWQRGFAAASISPDTPATAGLTPLALGMIGRQLCRRGEALFAIEVSRGMVRLLPAGSHDVAGPADERRWMYRLDLFGASGHTTRVLPGDAVIHCRYAVEPSTPWLGLPPMRFARTTAALAAMIETRLREEASGPVGMLLGGQESPDQSKDLAAGLNQTRGKLRIVGQIGLRGVGQGVPQAEARASRFGASPPEGLVSLRSDAARDVFTACGIPPSLVQQSSDGTAQRESWRRFLYGTLAPVARSVQAELRSKLDADITLSFDDLRAGDLAGNARSFSSMVAGGMDFERAAALAGLMRVEDD